MTRMRTLTDLQDALDADHAWRLKELMYLRLAIRSDKSQGNSALLRAGVPLLYAHWEGFIKCASMSYLKFVNSQKLRYEQLSACFIVFGARQHLGNLADSRQSKDNIAAVRFFLESLGEQAFLNVSSAVNTGSNLSSTIFTNIAVSLGIDPAPYQTRFNLIDVSLLKRRNSIAHGEYLDLVAADFLTLFDEVTALMRTYKDDVSHAASSKSYRRP